MNPPANNSEAIPVESDWKSRNHVHSLLMIGLTVLGIYLCYRIAAPFLPALAWALALAVLFAPVQAWLESKGERRGGAAAICVIAIAVIVTVPTVFVGQRLLQEAAKGTERLQQKIESGEWQEVFQNDPRLAGIVERLDNQVDLSGMADTLAAGMTKVAGSVVKGSVIQMVGILLTFYLLYFFLRDRRAALQAIRSLSPLTTAETNRLFREVADTIYATVYGSLVVAALQGFLAGLMFWWLGLPLPLLWGVIMALLSLVPVLGSFVVWIPAAIFLFAQGSWVKALILVSWGMLVVGTVDNLLRPVLVGKRLKMHTLLSFISLLGGLLVFGAAGLILGPVILTATIVLLEIWRTRIPGVPKSEQAGSQEVLLVRKAG